MRLFTSLSVLVTLLVLCARAWSPEDHQIFRMRDELAAAEGANVTFYSYLGVSPSASQEEIVKAQRSRSRKLHPDRAVPAAIAQREAAAVSRASKDKTGPTVKKGLSQKEKRQIEQDITARYQRFTSISEVLKGTGRERYDHFLRNGFPMWRGTGYYYARFRPGLGSVLVGLFLVIGGGVHYAAMYVGWKRHRDFVDRYIAHARRTAWGNDSGIPGLDALEGSGANGHPAPTPPPELEQEQDAGMALNRKQKRLQERESKKKEASKSVRLSKRSAVSRPLEAENMGQSPSGARKKVVAENGKVLIVDVEGNVFLEEKTEDGEMRELLLDPDEIPKPTIFQTALFRAPLWVYSRTVGRALGSISGVGPDEPVLENADITVNDPDQHQDEVFDAATSMNANGEVRKRKAKGKGKK